MSNREFDTAQAANYAGYSVHYLYQMRWDNRGPKSHRRRNGRLYYLQSDLDEWMAAQDAKAAACTRGGVNV